MMGDCLKKAIVIIFIILLFTPLFHGSVFTTVGQSPLPEWKVGDKWEYENQLPGMMTNSTTEVTEITTINVNGSDYDGYIVITTTKIIQPGITTTETINNYIIRNSLALIKTERNNNYPDGSLITTITHYSPPKQDYNFPIEVGKTWSSVSIKNSYSDIGAYYNTSISMNYSVVDVESITVKAGTFKCYKIEIDDGWGILSYNWYSPEVKNIVKTVVDSQELPSSSELTSYSFGEKKDKGFNLFSMPYILLLILIPIIVISLVILLVRRKGKKKKKGKKDKKSKGKKKKKEK